MRTLCLLFILTSSLAISQISYIPDRTARKEIANIIWEDLKVKTPTERLAMMENLIKSDELFKLYEKTISIHGMEPYEIAVVAGFVEDVCREVSTGYSITDAKSIENVNKMKDHYLANGIDVSLSNNSKQKKYDALILKTIWLGTINELANKKSSIAKTMANQLLETYIAGEFSVGDEHVNTIGQIPPSSQGPKESATTISLNNPKLKDVVMITTTSYGLGGMYISNDVYALFANGECLYEPSEPIESLDIPASKRTNYKHWDTWKMKNNIFYLKDGQDGKVSEWENWFKVRPATNNFLLNGLYKTSDPFTGGTITNSSIVFFDINGRFEWKTTKGGLGGWKPVLVNKNSSGTYAIKDRTITLNYGNGTSESFFFGLYPKDDLHFIVGSSHFRPVKK